MDYEKEFIEVGRGYGMPPAIRCLVCGTNWQTGDGGIEKAAARHVESPRHVINRDRRALQEAGYVVWEKPAVVLDSGLPYAWGDTGEIIRNDKPSREMWVPAWIAKAINNDRPPDMTPTQFAMALGEEIRAAKTAEKQTETP